MTTFSGDYVQEPRDFKVVATEPELINAFWDQDADDEIVTSDVDTFAELEASAPLIHAKVVANANEVIADAEEMIEAYARPNGYKIPLALAGVPDPIAKGIAVRLAWISARQRRHMLSSEQAELERGRIQRDELRDIARGVLVLTAERDTTMPAAGNVFAVVSSDRVFSREDLEGM